MRGERSTWFGLSPFRPVSGLFRPRSRSHPIVSVSSGCSSMNSEICCSSGSSATPCHMNSRSAKLTCGSSSLMTDNVTVLSVIAGLCPDRPLDIDREARQNGTDASASLAPTTDRKSQTADRRTGRLAFRDADRTIQCLRQSRLLLQGHATDQARSVPSAQFYPPWKEHEPVCRPAGCDRSSRTVGQLSSTPTTGQRLDRLVGRACPLPNSPAAAGHRWLKKEAKVVKSQAKRPRTPQNQTLILALTNVDAINYEFRDRN